MKLSKVGAVAAIAVIALSACNGAGSGKKIKFAIELPLQGSELAASQPIINGIKLAVKQAGNKVGDYTIDIPQSAIYDDALNGAHDAQTGAKNMNTIGRKSSDPCASNTDCDTYCSGMNTARWAMTVAVKNTFCTNVTSMM